ncbi:dimethyladenosine transferase [Vibrio zhanjiangensis]|uniref:Dimethyladenosine transferase n=1 Tax=Vibrio zhanjiangensis TaxID=1046128 RepID=A0ABQ6EWU7_9VIBR|nr:hypothetical protein [Vibrio zhanjiangensis]GLT17474.1 dimethyladenosine transferase [Vibrio zhanjiangensis]
MKYDVVNLTPSCTISNAVASKVNLVAGTCFDNHAIRMDFRQLKFNLGQQQDLIEISLVHMGVEAKGFLQVVEVERLLGLEIKHLDKEYVAYLITQNLAPHGVHFVGFMDQKEGRNLPLSITTVFECERLATTLYLELESIHIDADCLEAKPQALSGNLKLTVSWTPFETALTTQELSALSTDDVVLVYPK